MYSVYFKTRAGATKTSYHFAYTGYNTVIKNIESMKQNRLFLSMLGANSESIIRHVNDNIQIFNGKEIVCLLVPAKNNIACGFNRDKKEFIF